MEKTIILTILLVFFACSCAEKPTSGQSKYNLNSEKSEIEDSSNEQLITPSAEKKHNNESAIDDCTYDLSTQNTEFIDTVDDFSNYTWDNEKKTATIILENGDTLLASRGGCYHFAISGKWLLNKTIDLDSVNFILEKGKWIGKRLFDAKDYQELDILIEHGQYEINRSHNAVRLDFAHAYYLDWSINAFKRKNGKTTIETGYYF